MITVDLETFLIELPFSKIRPVICSYKVDGRDAELLSIKEAVQRIREDFSYGVHNIIGWNIGFDFLVLFKYMKEDILKAYANNSIIDIMIADKILAIKNGDFKRRRFSLEAAAKHWLLEDLSELKHGEAPIFSARSTSKLGKKRKELFEALTIAAKLRIRKNPNWIDVLDTALEEAEISFSDIPWRYKYAFLAGVRPSDYPQKAKEYALGDVIHTERIATKVQQAAIAEHYHYADEWPRAAAEESAYDFGLKLMAEVGYFTRTEYLKNLKNLHSKILESTTTALKAIGLLKLRTTGPHKGTYGMDQKMVRAAIADAYEKAGIPVPLTKGGAVSYSSSTLDQCPGRKMEMFKIWNESHRFLDVTYPLLYNNGKSRVFTFFDSMLITGRVASRDGGSGQFNSLNIAKKGGIQETFRPPTIAEAKQIHKELRLPFPKLPKKDRYVILDIDYSQAELFTAATALVYKATGKVGYTPGVSALADALMQKKDVHSMIGAADLGMTYEQFMKLKQQKDPVVLQARQITKAVDFGALGLMGPETMAIEAFSQGFKIETHPNGMWDFSASVATAKRVLDNMLVMFPDIKQHRDDLRYNRLSKTQEITAFAVPEFSLRGNCSAPQAGNYIIQKPAARMVKRLVFWLWYTIIVKKDPAFAGALPFKFLHDQVSMYVPESKGQEAAKLLLELAVKSKKLTCPGMITGKDAEPVLSDLVSKSAEPTYKNGKLVTTRIKKSVPTIALPWGDKPMSWLWDGGEVGD